MPIKVLLVDDHEIIRQGLKQMFVGTDIVVVGEAGSGDQALRVVSDLSPDLVLLDIRMQGGDGLKFLMHMKLESPSVPVLVLSAFDNPTFIHQAIALSAAGYLLKTVSRERLLETIKKVAAGERAWRRDELRRITGALATPRLDSKSEVPLTQRESEVLTHMCEGLTNREIARSMEISYETVKEHVQHILRKIGVADRTQAAVWAVRQGLN